LRKDDGSVAEQLEEIKLLAKQYFEEMYTRDTLVTPDLIEELIEEKVNEETNKNLIRDFTEEEIRDALFQIGPLKAPGADGFPARFFQRN
jgi:hypothetical protein